MAVITAFFMGTSSLLARGAPPPLALTRRLRASLWPQALSYLLAGPHPRSRSLGDSAPRSGRRRFLTCSRGPTPARARSATARLARAAGASYLLAGPHPRSRSLGDSAPRSGRRRFL